MINLLKAWAKQCAAAFNPPPDPALDLIPATRITTDYYPVLGRPGTRCERYYAEKQANGLLCLKFQSCAGGGTVANAMADAALNRPPFPSNLTLEQALKQLRAYDESGKARAGEAWFKAPPGDMPYARAEAILAASAAQAPAPPAPQPG